MGLFDLLGSAASGAAQEVISFTQQRHKVIANNIANIDTPGYRMRDLDQPRFESQLARVLKANQRANPNISQAPSLAATPQAGGARAAEADRVRGIVFHDDNDRSVEKLVVAMQQNASRHNQAVNLLRSQIRTLRNVISEQVNA